MTQSGGGVRGVGQGVERGGGIYIKMKFSNKTGIVTLILVIRMHITRQNRPKSRFSGGFPNFWREFPRNDIIILEKHHILTPKWDCERTHCAMPRRKKGSHLDFWAHLRISNSNISVIGHYFKPKMEISTDFSVIWRWYKWLVTVFSGFWVKIRGSRAHGSRSTWNLRVILWHKNVCTYIHTYVHPPTPYRQPSMCWTQFWTFPDTPLDPPLTQPPLTPNPPAFWGSLLPTKEVPHTCKIVYYF